MIAIFSKSLFFLSKFVNHGALEYGSSHQLSSSFGPPLPVESMFGLGIRDNDDDHAGFSKKGNQTEVVVVGGRTLGFDFG